MPLWNLTAKNQIPDRIWLKTAKSKHKLSLYELFWAIFVTLISQIYVFLCFICEHTGFRLIYNIFGLNTLPERAKSIASGIARWNEMWINGELCKRVIIMFPIDYAISGLGDYLSLFFCRAMPYAIDTRVSPLCLRYIRTVLCVFVHFSCNFFACFYLYLIDSKYLMCFLRNDYL
jgi:hypothetical protein